MRNHVAFLARLIWAVGEKCVCVCVCAELMLCCLIALFT